MNDMPRFALNHMASPRLDLDAFCDLAAGLALDAIEIRNDLFGNAILDGTPPQSVRDAATALALTILSINALQKFNHWDDERKRDAIALADYAQACGAKALVLVPANDGSGLGNGERQANLRIALKALAPILTRRGLIGLVEPLGFESCSLTLKSEAVAAMDATDRDGVFRLVHDTFHHHLAGETALFPDRTGLVHISGVEDPSLEISDMRDGHRLLVGPGDRLENAAQMRALLAGGYRGHFSFEPFASSVHALSGPAVAIGESMDFLRAALARPEA